MKAVFVAVCLALGAPALFAWDGPKLTVDPAAAPVTRTWEDVKSSVAASVARTSNGYFAHSHAFNDLGPIDTSGTLTDEELRTQFAMACVLASPITVKGPAKPQVAQWLDNKMLMNVNNDKVARQGHVVADRDGTLVIVKYLWGMNNGTLAVAFYNPTDEARRISATAEELCLAGKIDWTDRFDPACKGVSESGLAFDVPAHGTRLVFASGTASLRRLYRAECAVDGADGSRLWNCLFVSADGEYALAFRANGSAPYRVKVNGLDRGEFRGEAQLAVPLWHTENTVRLEGPGAREVEAMTLR